MIITERKNFENTHLCLNVNNVSIVGTDHLGSAVAHKSRSEGAYIETACSRDLRHVVGIITLAYSSIVTLHCSFHSQQCNPQQEFSCGHNCHVSWQNMMDVKNYPKRMLLWSYDKFLIQEFYLIREFYNIRYFFYPNPRGVNLNKLKNWSKLVLFHWPFYHQIYACKITLSVRGGIVFTKFCQVTGIDVFRNPYCITNEKKTLNEITGAKTFLMW